MMVLFNMDEQCHIHIDMSQIRLTYVMYQSNRSFNIPLGNIPGIWIFEKFLIKFPPHRAEKLFKCPHPRENYRIATLTF